MAINEIERHKDKILDKILEKPPEPPPVKLVISKKKGSIFKSRALVSVIRAFFYKSVTFYTYLTGGRWL